MQLFLKKPNFAPAGKSGGFKPASENGDTMTEKKKEASEADPFALDNLTVDGTTMEDLGIERPLLVVPVQKPNPQDFFQVHPDPAYRLTARVLELKAERETYLVTKAVWPLIPGETKLVTLLVYQSRHGGLSVWPLKQAEEGVRDNTWNISARKASELAADKWVRMQANMGNASYDVVTTDKIPSANWPDTPLSEILRIAFGDGKLIDRADHPVIRQLMGE